MPDAVDPGGQSPQSSLRAWSIELRRSSYDHPDARALTELAQQHYVEIYGGPDRDPLSVEQFTPPHGGFVIGYADGAAVAMGGWHFVAGGDAQVRRMYVTPAARGRGCGRAVLHALEADAAAHGAARMILSTGPGQPEAVGLYRAAGYVDIEPFGFYGDRPRALHLGKPLV